MYCRPLLLLLIIYSATGEIATSDKDAPEKSRMMGVDAIHDAKLDNHDPKLDKHETKLEKHESKIDKDTIITRNLKLDRKGRPKNAHHHKKQEDSDPDWSYSAFPQEVTNHVDQFKRNMSECLKEVQANDKRTVKRLSPKQESPVHGECLIACVLKRNGVIENGKINKGNLISLVSKFYAKDTKLMKKLEKNLDRCIEMSIRNRDECTLASQLNDCTNDLMASNKHKIVVNY